MEKIMLRYAGLMKNDLHIRTNFSASADKDCNYEKVLKLCEEQKLDRISIKNDFDILIKDEYNESIYISNKDFFSGIFQMNIMTAKSNFDKKNILEKNDKYQISEIKDDSTNIKYIIFI